MHGHEDKALAPNVRAELTQWRGASLPRLQQAAACTSAQWPDRVNPKHTLDVNPICKQMKGPALREENAAAVGDRRGARLPEAAGQRLHEHVLAHQAPVGGAGRAGFQMKP